ncbi:MAG: hypothetical protein ACJASL_005091 [Paraglaciecola sp.]|jgi:hypothetical protein
MLYYNNSLVDLKMLVIYERQTRHFFRLLVPMSLFTNPSTHFSHGANEVSLTVLGSICLIGAHFLSLTLARHKATS